MASPTTLILLPCHSIWKFYDPTDPCAPGYDAAEWSLASFQIASDDQRIFIEHLKKSISLIDDESVVIISGGATKLDTGPLTESQSYYYLGKALGLIKEHNKLSVILENFARDSMENLLFALMRFSQVYGVLPEKLIIVGFEFKRHRFLENHCKSLGLTNVEYIGFNPVLHNEGKEKNEEFIKETEMLEFKHAVQHFDKDPLGIKTILKSKKASRDPYKNGGESNYLSQCQIPFEDLLTDPFLIKFYSQQEIEENQDILKLYKYIISRL